MEYVLDGLTLGQVYVLFDDAIEYVKTTSPFGAGDESGGTSSRSSSRSDRAVRRHIGPNDEGAAEMLLDSGLVLPVLPTVNLSDLPADDQQWLADLAKEFRDDG